MTVISFVARAEVRVRSIGVVEIIYIASLLVEIHALVACFLRKIVAGLAHDGLIARSASLAGVLCVAH